MQASEYLQDLVADWIRGTAFPTAPVSLKLALSTADPQMNESGFTEPSGGSYARQTITLDAPLTNEASGAATSNSTAITFTNMPACTVTHAAIFTVGGDMLLFGELSAPRVVPGGDTVSFNANALSVALKGRFGEYAAEAIINWMRGTAMPTAPTSTKMQLSRSSPLRDDSGADFPPGTDGYAAVTVAFNAPSFTNGTGTTLENTSPLIFGPCHTNSWGVITYAAVYDQDDNLLVYGALAVPKTVAIGEGMGFAAGAVSLLLH